MDLEVWISEARILADTFLEPASGLPSLRTNFPNPGLFSGDILKAFRKSTERRGSSDREGQSAWGRKEKGGHRREGRRHKGGGASVGEGTKRRGGREGDGRREEGGHRLEGEEGEEEGRV